MSAIIFLLATNNPEVLPWPKRVQLHWQLPWNETSRCLTASETVTKLSLTYLGCLRGALQCFLGLFFFSFHLPLYCMTLPTHDFLRSMTHFPPMRDKSDFHFVSGSLWVSWKKKKHQVRFLIYQHSVWRNEHIEVNITSINCRYSERQKMPGQQSEQVSFLWDAGTI